MPLNLCRINIQDNPFYIDTLWYRCVKSCMRQMRILPLGLIAVLFSTAGCSPSASKPRIKTYNLGDRVQAGSLVYQVYEAKWQTQFGEGTTAKVPKNRFLVVRLNVVNSGATESLVPTLSVADDSGQ